ncbi:hypothetical protein ABPG72_001842 [Tetrahymena utriculariae]
MSRSTRSVSSKVNPQKYLLDLSVANYYDYEYFQTPKSFVQSLQETPNRLPNHYRNNLMLKIQDQYDKFENNLKKKQIVQVQQRMKVNEFEQYRENKLNWIDQNVSKTTELKAKKIETKVKKISEYNSHVQQTQRKHKTDIKQDSREKAKNIKLYQDDMSQFMETREKSFFQTSQTRNLSQMQERENYKKQKYDIQLEQSNKKYHQLTDKLESGKHKRDMILAQKTQTAAKVDQILEQNLSIHEKNLQRHQNEMLAKMTEKLEKINMTNIIKEKANQIIMEKQKQEQKEKNEILHSNQQKLRENQLQRVKVLNQKFNSPVKMQKSPSKMNVGEQIVKVLTNYDKLKQKQEIKNQQLLQNHLEYTTNNKILKVSYDKLNDYKRRAYFLQKKDDI